MRYESATVPAAVMPDHALRDDGFRNTCHCPESSGWEGFLKPGQVRRPAKLFYVQSFREEKHRIVNDSRLSDSRQPIIKVDLEKTLFFHYIFNNLSSAGTNTITR